MGPNHKVVIQKMLTVIVEFLINWSTIFQKKTQIFWMREDCGHKKK